MVADAVIYHPTVTHYLKYVATTGKPLRTHPPSLFSPKPRAAD
jgi:hypothetical protein